MRLEIEHKYLLRDLPDLPGGARGVRIEQGYLGEPPDDGPLDLDGFVAGRIRRSRDADGSVRCTHTIKRGHGLVREEIERDITTAQFDELWPRTAGARVTKTRYTVDENGARWEIDAFEGLDLVLAEVEVEDVDDKVVLPQWLRAQVVREVTGERKYENAVIAEGTKA